MKTKKPGLMIVISPKINGKSAGKGSVSLPKKRKKKMGDMSMPEFISERSKGGM